MRQYTYESTNDNNLYFLVIYDISDNRRRTKLAKLLEEYGNRVQYSAFEFWLPKGEYDALLQKIHTKVTIEDSLRIYMLNKASYRKDESNGVCDLRADVIIA